MQVFSLHLYEYTENFMLVSRLGYNRHQQCEHYIAQRALLEKRQAKRIEV